MSGLREAAGARFPVLPFLRKTAIVLSEGRDSNDRKGVHMKKAGIHEENIIRQLEEIAEGLGIKVRHEQVKKEGVFFPGGLCKVKGEHILILNSRAGTEDKIETLARALASFDLSRIYIRPALRDLLSRFSPARDADPETGHSST